MERIVLQEAHILEKRMYAQLSEFLDISQQLAQALDRDDNVSVQMLISMRGDPARKLRQTRKALEALRDSLPGDQGRRLAELLNGGAAANAEEQPLAEQVAVNSRLLQRTQDLDKILSGKVTQEQSYYSRK